MNITGDVLPDEIIMDFIGSYATVHSVKKAIKNNAQASEVKIEFKERFFQDSAGVSPYTTNVAVQLMVDNLPVWTEVMKVETQGATMMTAQDRNILVKIVKTRMVKNIFVFGLNSQHEKAYEESKSSGE